MKIPAGRSKLDKPLNQMTKEELLRRFELVGSAYGACTIQGNVLSRKHPSNAQVIPELARLASPPVSTSLSLCGQSAHTATTPAHGKPAAITWVMPSALPGGLWDNLANGKTKGIPGSVCVDCIPRGSAQRSRLS
jgi:hypothetical protein